jgi:hypothetical protein
MAILYGKLVISIAVGEPQQNKVFPKQMDIYIT